MKHSLKVRTFNFFRNVFKIGFIERRLAAMTRGKMTNAFFCRLVPNPYQYNTGSIRILQRDGIHMNVDLSDYIGHYLYFGFKDPALEKLFAFCGENTTVIDVGANLGWTVLSMAKIAKNGRVMGFEPDPYNFERLRENLSINDFKNVGIFQMGLGNKNEELNIEVRTASNRGGNRIGPRGMPVSIVKMDDFAPISDLVKIDLIKMDVEGFELRVLQGAERLIRQHHPILFIEVDDNNLKDQGDSALSLIQFLFQHGYSKVENAESGTVLTPASDFTNCHFDIIAR